MSWQTYNITSTQYHLSDLTGFYQDEVAYFIGGYNASYTAQSAAFMIDPRNNTEEGGALLNITDIAPLPTARADLSSITYSTASSSSSSGGDTTTTNYAIVTGGFTHANNFCAPLKSSEQYNFATREWSVLDDLSIGRGDKALVRVNDDTSTASDTQDDSGEHSTQQRIYAIGGERQIENKCIVTPEDAPEPGEETVPVDDVEYYNIATNEWTVIEELPEFRFRFAAVGYNNTIYTFGGQYAFNKTCQCFPTSNDVILYTELFATTNGTTNGTKTTSGSIPASGMTYAGVATVTIFSWLMMMAAIV
jgi:hypothetical protein